MVEPKIAPLEIGGRIILRCWWCGYDLADDGSKLKNILADLNNNALNRNFFVNMMNFNGITDYDTTDNPATITTTITQKDGLILSRNTL